jgi:hypothetical protein
MPYVGDVVTDTGETFHFDEAGDEPTASLRQQLGFAPGRIWTPHVHIGPKYQALRPKRPLLQC